MIFESVKLHVTARAIDSAVKSEVCLNIFMNLYKIGKDDMGRASISQDSSSNVLLHLLNKV